MNYPRYFRYSVFVFLTLFLGITGCRKERPKPSWTVDLLSPLFIDTIGVNDVFNDSLIVENPDQLLSFVFNEKLHEVNVDSLVKLPDTLFHWSYGMDWLPFPIPLAPGDLIIDEVFDLALDYESFGFEGIALEDAFIRSGTIIFEVLNQSSGPILSNFSINSAIKNETDTFAISKTVGAGIQISEAFDFSDYHLDLTGSNHDTVNKLNYHVGLFADPGIPDTLILMPVDSFSINIYFEDIVMDYAKGNFGKNEHHIGPDISELSFFDDLNIGGISFKDAQISLQINSNYGVDGNLKIEEILAMNTSTNESIALQGSIVDSTLYLPGAVQSGNGLGLITPTINNYDFSETNFNDLLQIIPNQISYTLDITTNPTDDSISRDHFFYYDYPIEIYLDLEVSQGIRIDDMFVDSRSNWNGSGIDLEDVGSGKLILKYLNWFPFSFDMDMFLEDENMEVLDTIFFQRLVGGGLPNENGRVDQAEVSEIQVEISESLKSSLNEAKYAYFQIYINSVEGQHVKIYADYMMVFRMIGEFEYEVKP